MREGGADKMKAKLTSVLLMVILILVGSALASVDVTLTDVDGNQVQGEQFMDTFTVTNNGDSSNITFSASDLVMGTDSISSSAISFTPSTIENMVSGGSEDITITIDISADQALGTYTGTITATASNGTETDNFSSNITLEVLTSNHEPVFTSSPSESAIIGEEYQYQATATDEDSSDTLTFALVSGPAGMIITADGLLSWTPANLGSEEVNISVTDGRATVYQSWTITVREPTASLSMSPIYLGDSHQKREEHVSDTFILKNTGTVDITDISLSTTADSDFEVIFSIPTSNLAAGEEMVITIDAFVPKDLDAKVNNIGSVTATGTATNVVSTTTDLFMEAENNLVIDDVDITIDGKKKNLDDGDDFDVKPGDEVELKIKVANTFDENIDIEDIEVAVESDNELDWDDSEDINRIRDDDDDTVTLTFKVAFDIDDDEAPFDVEIRVEGEDENGANHGETWEFEIDIDKERDEIIISDLDLRPSLITCDDSSVTLDVELTNIGRDDQDEAVLKVDIEDLGFERIIKDISLDEGDDITKRISINLPDGVKEGLYDIDVRVYTSDNDRDLTDVEVITLTIDGCSDYPTSTSNNVVEGNSNNAGSSDEMNIITQPPTNSAKIVQTVSGTKKTSDDTYLTLLIVIIVLLLIVIVFLGVKAFRPTKK